MSDTVCYSCGNGFGHQCQRCERPVCDGCAEDHGDGCRCMVNADPETLSEENRRFVAQTAPHDADCDCAVNPANDSASAGGAGT